MSVLAGIARKGSLLLMDRLCHASLRCGARLSGAQIANFRHNDFTDALKQMRKFKFDRIIVVIEGV